MGVIAEFEANKTWVRIKFNQTVALDTLINSNIQVQRNDATPVSIASPFHTIYLAEDYNSIGRMLTLFWNNTPDVNASYTLKTVNLKNAALNAIADDQITFTPEDVSVDSTLFPGEIQVTVNDESIATDYFVDLLTITDSAANSQFFVVTIDPPDGDYQVAAGYANGRITIEFSTAPAANYVNSSYFKVYKKKLQKAPNKWTEVTSTLVSSHSTKPLIFIDMPSVGDATPVYNTPNHTYYEDSYKYRVRISKSVAA